MLRPLLLLGATLLLAGCDSLPSIGERYSAVPPQTRVFSADHRTTYFAAQLAVKKVDFVLTKSAIEQGIVEARSGLRGDNAFEQVRQLTLEIRLNDIDASHTEVAVLLREQIEDTGHPGATEQTLRAHGLYDTYFAMLEQAIREGANGPAGSGR